MCVRVCACVEKEVFVYAYVLRVVLCVFCVVCVACVVCVVCCVCCCACCVFRVGIILFSNRSIGYLLSFSLLVRFFLKG